MTTKTDIKILEKKIKSKYWRLNNLYSIVCKDGKDRVFQFNEEQQKLWKQCFEKNNLICNPNVLKARQLGITTFFVLCYLDDALWSSNLNVYIQSHDQESIKKIFRIIIYAYNKLPEILRPKLSKGGGSMYEYYFPGINSRIYVGLENRSSTIHRLHLSEVAFQAPSRISATLGALPPNVFYSSETTPNGMNWYFDDYNLEQPNRKNIFFPWYRHAFYTLPPPSDFVITPDEGQFRDNIRHKLNLELTNGQLCFRRQKIADLKSIYEFSKEYPNDEESCFQAAESSRIVIPEAQNESFYLGEQERPQYLNYQVCFDLGLKDYFGAIFFYCDFKKSIMVIENEYWVNYKSTAELVNGMREVEKALNIPEQHWKPTYINSQAMIDMYWTNPNKSYEPHRYADSNDPQQIFDMNKDHDYEVHPVVKRAKMTNQGFRDSVRNQFRVGLSNRKILIHPRCKQLIKQMKMALWNEQRTDYMRIPSFGHWDLLVAAFYGFDNVFWDKNPYPLIFPGVIANSEIFVHRRIIEKQKNASLLLGRKK